MDMFENSADDYEPTVPNWVLAALVVPLAILVGALLERWIGTRGVALVFMAAVVSSASFSGLKAGLLSAVCAFLSLNYFFIEPRYTFAITEQQEFFSLGVFLVVAAISGTMAGRMREQLSRARRRAFMLSNLSEFSRLLAEAKTGPHVLTALVDQASKTVQGPAALVRNIDNGPVVDYAAQPSLEPDEIELHLAEKAFRTNQDMTTTAPGWPNARFEYRFIDKVILPDCLLALAPFGGNRAASSDAEGTLHTMMEQAALTIERIRLSSAKEDADAVAKEERLRSTLLSSVSHDLRTPLASILGSVTSLREFGSKMPKAAQRELLAGIEDETRRLSQLVANLLNMTKLQSGLQIRSDVVDPITALKESIAAIKLSFPKRKYELKVDGPIGSFIGDRVLFCQAIFNLLENATKFSPLKSEIVVNVGMVAKDVEVQIIDQGVGISAADRARVFDKFYSGKPTLTGQSGAGLGLAIVKGVVEAMGGTIEIAIQASDNIGTIMVMRLPATGKALLSKGARQ